MHVDPKRVWWKVLLAGLAAAVGAALAWGWMEPEPEPEPGPGFEPGPPSGILAHEPGGTAGGYAESVVTPAPGASAVPSQAAPAWVRPTILWAIAVVAAVVLAVSLLGILREVLTWLVLALFFSFALEPAVNYMQRRWHWRRGVATFVLLAIAAAALIAIAAIFVVTLVRGVDAIVRLVPGWADSFATWAHDTFGAEVTTAGVSDQAADASASLKTLEGDPIRALLGLSVSLVGGFFAFFSVATFCFYMVAEGPRFKRAVLAFFSAKRQDELVAIWEAAIDKTGGYFYSRLLVAVINGVISFVVLWLLDVPGAVALASFQGAVAAFIPIVGTYIGSAVPVMVALLAGGPATGLIYLGYVLVYQQVENYLIAPKLQGKAMALHPAVAFGVAMAGGALGGLLWAFLALPFAATIQASASLWIQRHEVVASPFVEEAPPLPSEPSPDRTGWTHRLGSWAAEHRGWIRRIGEDDAQPEPVAADPDEPDAPVGGFTRSG